MLTCHSVACIHAQTFTYYTHSSHTRYILLAHYNIYVLTGFMNNVCNTSQIMVLISYNEPE